jgi:geranylgeranyl pyrophosphate synthase
VSPEDAQRILGATLAAGGVDRARAKARELAAVAVVELAALRPSPYRQALEELAALSVDRKF